MRADLAALGFLVIVVFQSWIRDFLVRAVVITCLIALAWRMKTIVGERTLRMHLIGDANETLVLDGRLAGRDALFQLDTGYAGPPVLSTTYLSLNEDARARISAQPNVVARYKDTLSNIQAVPGEAERARAVDAFLRHSGCDAYTSGCTMRLMGIGSIVEQQADMLLCDALRFANVDGRFVAPKSGGGREGRGDVLVTNPLPSSVHILTCDYLLHMAPCCLSMRDATLELNMSQARHFAVASSFRTAPLVVVGGAPVIDVRIGMEDFRCTVDTGAPGAICLGLDAAPRLTACVNRARSLRQRGVNGESICSSVVVASASIVGLEAPDAVVLVNDTRVDHTDGYVGMGFLRAFDILLTHTHIGFRLSGLPAKRVHDFPTSEKACDGVPLKCVDA